MGSPSPSPGVLHQILHRARLGASLPRARRLHAFYQCSISLLCMELIFFPRQLRAKKSSKGMPSQHRKKNPMRGRDLMPLSAPPRAWIGRYTTTTKSNFDCQFPSASNLFHMSIVFSDSPFPSRSIYPCFGKMLKECIHAPSAAAAHQTPSPPFLYFILRPTSH